MSEFAIVFFQRCRIRCGIGYIDCPNGDYVVVKITYIMEQTRSSTMLEF